MVHIQGDPKESRGLRFWVGLDLSGTASTYQIAAFLMQGDRHGLEAREMRLLASYRARDRLTLRSRARISHPENCLWRRPPRRIHLGVLQLTQAVAQGSRVEVC